MKREYAKLCPISLTLLIKLILTLFVYFKVLKKQNIIIVFFSGIVKLCSKIRYKNVSPKKLDLCFVTCQFERLPVFFYKTYNYAKDFVNVYVLLIQQNIYEFCLLI